MWTKCSISQLPDIHTHLFWSVFQSSHQNIHPTSPMHATYLTIKNKWSFKGVNMVSELRTVQNTTRFRELFLHSTEKPCSRLKISILSVTCGGRCHEFSAHTTRGALTQPSPTPPQWILFTLGLNTFYSCQRQVICSWKYAWLFLKLQPQSPNTDRQRVALYHHMHGRQEDCKSQL